MGLNNNIYLLAADAILVLHFAFVAFVVLGLMITWIGYFFRLKFIRNAKFRVCHICAMGIVLVESLIGMICPLTEWENRLRIKGGEGRIYEASFIKKWIHKIMFYEFSEQTFMVIYILFFALVFFTFWFIPPQRKSKTESKKLKE